MTITRLQIRFVAWIWALIAAFEGHPEWVAFAGLILITSHLQDLKEKR